VVKRDVLLELREEEHAKPSNRGAGFVLVTERALTQHNLHIARIDRQLTVIERDMTIISEHCTANDDEFQDAMQRYKKEYCEAFERALGLAIACKQADAALQKLT
jgi:hypothetical protein